MEILVDAGEALPRIKDEIAAATSRVHLAVWHLEPGFEIEPPGLSIKDLLAQVARSADVRVLMWGGTPLPTPFHPSRRDMRAVCAELAAAGVSCALDSKERPLHCHHEKIIVVDDRVAFVGGLDLTTLGGDRHDDILHIPRGSIGWHDAAACLSGPIVNDVSDHFSMRWKEVTGERLAPVPTLEPTSEGVEAQIVRTVPEKAYSTLPRGDFRILEAYVRALRSATRLVYLENQFLWSNEIVSLLADKLRHPPDESFRLLLVLPSKAMTGTDNTLGQLSLLEEADAGADRLLVCTAYAHDGPHAQPIYVHAKIGIVDDRWLTIGSANLNEHSLLNDTEVNLIACDEQLARQTRQRLWAEHLETAVENVLADPTELFDAAFRPVAREQADRLTRGMPPTGRIAKLPGVSRRSKRMLGPIQDLLIDT
ncbi:MAG: phospholipase D-like domain-containing protein [Actinomycetota bacterium]